MSSNWTQIRVACRNCDIDAVCAVMSMVDNGLMIEDATEIDKMDTCYGELMDESMTNADRSVGAVSVYIPDERNPAECIAFIKEHLTNVKYELTLSGVKEEDWANTWKQYYKPVRIGKRLIVVPTWEKYEPKEDDIVLMMDPGMAFGTGTHETTRLCSSMMEEYLKKGDYVLDVGTGSGILAICASKLGAGECRAYDIDPMAVRVANENIKDSGLSNITCEVSDLLRQVDRSKKYDLICANIVADIIIRMTPDVGELMHENTVLLASGIIKERSEDVIECFEKNGFRIVEQLVDNGWCGLAVMKA
jgi:ribosomal protein L11 methyltransferase